MSSSKAGRSGVPIIIFTPDGQPIPVSSLEMTAAYFSELIMYITGEPAKFLDHRYIRGRLNTGETEFTSGPLKGFKIMECKSYVEQRQLLFEVYHYDLVYKGGIREKENKRNIELENNRIGNGTENRTEMKRISDNELKPNITGKQISDLSENELKSLDTSFDDFFKE